jgi:hypothetical protein
MIDGLLFAEDDAQERFVGTLVRRVALEHGTPMMLRVRSARGGFGKMLQELGTFATAVDRRRETGPDVVIVAADANCRGWIERRQQVEQHAGAALTQQLVTAIADPHVERWFLVDGAAFRAVLGRGCQAPDQKCEKDRYKNLLMQAVLDAGVQPLLGGIEYAEDLAQRMDLQRAAAADGAFGRFIETLRKKLDQFAQ